VSVDRSCWCGNTALEPFDADYRRCPACETLVLRHETDAEAGRVVNDDADFYGKDYWFGHQVDDLGHVDLVERARRDLGERCLHWLRAVLRYRVPPARVLELGSAHGGFVYLLAAAGFESAGLELSPFVVDFARRTFGVRMYGGPIEDQSIDPASLALIAAMDVLEHLKDPAATLSTCAALLQPDGQILLQTPCYREGTTAEDMRARADPFLVQLKANEHLYLFSRTSLRRLLAEAGFAHVEFLPAIFAHYDMFAIASRQPLAETRAEDVERALVATPAGRLVLAMIDTCDELGARDATWQQRLEVVEGDRLARGAVIEAQGDELARTNLQTHEWLQDLHARLAEAEADRAARLGVIETQGQELAILRARLDTERATVDAQRTELELRQSALERQHEALEAVRAVVEAQRSELGSQHSALEAQRDELAGMRRVIEAQRSALESQQRAFEAQRTGLEALSAELSAQRHEVQEFRAFTTSVQRSWPFRILHRLGMLPGTPPGGGVP
jgi:SAM-dependent methyltransferase